MDDSPAPPAADGQPRLVRRFGLLQATALNMSNMVGAGPFITIPLLLSAMMGPQALLGWAVAFLITVNDALVWSELGAALPGSGGSYLYLRDGFGRQTWGRLMAFMFIWQFILSGPMEIATGYIGFAQYAGYLWRTLSENHWQMVAVAGGVGLLNIALLYRRIGAVGHLTVTLWAGMLVTVAAVLVTGALHFDARRAFDFPPMTVFSLGFLHGLGGASRIGIYDYLGYYDVCYIGEEVRQPGRVIPRSILISLLVVAVVYVGINLSIIGVVPWRELADAAQQNLPAAQFMVSIFMERVYGPGVATVFTLMILWTTFASTFALLLGYSRIPYAAAEDGYFFRVFARLHPTQQFPHVSLLVIGLLAVGCCALDLGQVIEALLVTRIAVQFIGQIGAVILLRRKAPGLERPYRIPLFPLPPLLALAGWLFVLFTSGGTLLLYGMFFLVLGLIAFVLWSRVCGAWPFGNATGDDSSGA